MYEIAGEIPSPNGNLTIDGNHLGHLVPQHVLQHGLDAVFQGIGGGGTPAAGPLQDHVHFFAVCLIGLEYDIAPVTGDGRLYIFLQDADDFL